MRRSKAKALDLYKQENPEFERPSGEINLKWWMDHKNILNWLITDANLENLITDVREITDMILNL